MSVLISPPYSLSTSTDSNGNGGKEEDVEAEFEFKDYDNLVNEINELYTYSELSSYKKQDLPNQLNQDLLRCNNSNLSWNQQSENAKLEYIQDLLNHLDSSPYGTESQYQKYKLKANLLLYIAQGTPEIKPQSTTPPSRSRSGSPKRIKAQNESLSLKSVESCRLIRKANALPILLKSLLLSKKISLDNLQKELENNIKKKNFEQGHTRTSSKPIPNSKKADPLMCILLNIIYLLVVTYNNNNNNINNNDNGNGVKVEEEECDILEAIDTHGQNINSIMLDLILDFSEFEGNTFPIKKILLVFWKTLHIKLGGYDKLKQMKDQRLKSINYNPELPKTRTVDISNFIKGTSRYHHQYMDHSQLHKVESHLINQNIKESNKKYELIRLPSALGDSLRVLEQNLYPPLEVEKEIGYASFYQNQSTNKPRILLDSISPFEDFYSSNLPNLSRLIIVLLKILLASEPSIKNYTGPINLMTEIVVGDISPGKSSSLVESMQSVIDFQRHKEIVMKSIFAILLLILKHAKMNQTIQYDNIIQIMFESNAIILFYKYLNHEKVDEFLNAQNYISSEEFYQNQPQIQYSWRNLFSTTLILRLLQKLTKGLPSRICAISPTKSINILKMYYNVKYPPLISYYTLKNIKNIIPYQTKKWKQNNMKIITDIYLQVPIHINDVWLSMKKEPSKQEVRSLELEIQERIDEYHALNYDEWQPSNIIANGFKNPSSQDPLEFINESILNNPIELSEEDKEVALELGDIYQSDHTSIITVQDFTEDQLLFEKWNISKPSFINNNNNNNNNN